MPPLHLATFRTDATVPLGHPLCGGWIKPATTVTEPLSAVGVVLLGNEAPVVLCAVDWTGICNGANRLWREALARAAHTTPERVAVHCVHPHNAPFADVAAQELVGARPGLAPIVDLPWLRATVEKTAQAVQASLARAQAVTHLALGRARVEQVASNRRLVGPEGKLTGWRGSSCKDAKLREAPEGLIDPWLQSLSFWAGDAKLAALHWYACHPMSYYGDGAVTPDFPGLARDRRAKEEGVPHLYFTGCAGNVAAGKYNDGSPATRPVLAERIYTALVASEKDVKRRPAPGFRWVVREKALSPRSDVTDADLLRTLDDATKATALRNRAALQLAFRRRAAEPIPFTALHLGEDIALAQLPGECFIEYQLAAQEWRPGAFVAVAAYGDGGPWYVPLQKTFPEGGYEPSVAFAAPETETLVRGALAEVLG